VSKATLKEIAKDLGLDGGLEDRGGMIFLALDNRYAVMEDEKGLHLTDLVSWARFSPMTIGRKSSVTRKGLEFQIAQLARYKKQIGAVA
jgi:hypothetical protein